MEDNLGAYKIKLTEEDNSTIKKILDQFVISGDRYPAQIMGMLNL